MRDVGHLHLVLILAVRCLQEKEARESIASRNDTKPTHHRKHDQILSITICAALARGHQSAHMRVMNAKGPYKTMTLRSTKGS